MATDLTNALARQGLYELLKMRLLKQFAVANPGAGIEWSAVVPAGVWWEVVFVQFNFNASAVVANRGVNLIGKTSEGNVFRLPPLAAAVASAGSQWVYNNAGYGFNGGGVTVPNTLGLPPNLLPPTATLGSNTVNIDVGDTYASITFAVREWSPQQVAAQAVWIGRQLPDYDIIDQGAE